MEKNFVTALTAQNATETNKTLIDTVLVPQGVTKLVEVGAVAQMPGVTTLEGIGYILELECDDSSNWGGTQQFAQACVSPLGTDLAVKHPATIHDVNIPVQPGAHIKFSTTFNVALTINPIMRGFGKFV